MYSVLIDFHIQMCYVCWLKVDSVTYIGIANVSS